MIVNKRCINCDNNKELYICVKCRHFYINTDKKLEDLYLKRKK